MKKKIKRISSALFALVLSLVIVTGSVLQSSAATAQGTEVHFSSGYAWTAYLSYSISGSETNGTGRTFTYNLFLWGRIQARKTPRRPVYPGKSSQTTAV